MCVRFYFLSTQEPEMLAWSFKAQGVIQLLMKLTIFGINIGRASNTAESLGIRLTEALLTNILFG